MELQKFVQKFLSFKVIISLKICCLKSECQ